MSYPKYNKKLEKAPYDDGRSEPTYPWIRGEADINGAHKMVYADPDKFEKSYTETFDHSASFTIDENADSDKKGLRNSLKHEVRDYNSGGVSQTGEGHMDKANLQGGSERKNFKGDSGKSVTGQIYSGAGETSVSGSKDGGYNHDNGDQYSTTSGTHVKEHTGDTFHHYEGDKAETVIGNKVCSTTGEYALHLQSGNMDTKVDSGKIKFEAGNDIIIKSGTKITIVVGSSSIVIESSKITITSGEVEFVRA